MRKKGREVCSMNIDGANTRLNIKKADQSDLVIALAGNPNVGKSTVFNQLTGMRQHTGNWAGKTVCNAQGYCTYEGQGYVLVDIPGCYSLMAHSAEEQAARDFLCWDDIDVVVVVCDAVCLERNLNLVLQILEMTSRVVVCVNLMDEAKKKHITIHFDKVSERLGVPVVGITARNKKGLSQIFESVHNLAEEDENKIFVSYPHYIERAVKRLEPEIRAVLKNQEKSRWFSLRLLSEGEEFMQSAAPLLDDGQVNYNRLIDCLKEVNENLSEYNITAQELNDTIASAFIKRAEAVCSDAVQYEEIEYNQRDRKLDQLFTSKKTGFPIMFAVLLFMFWLTIVGSNYPSDLLSRISFWLEARLLEIFSRSPVPEPVYNMFIQGGFRVLAWVVSVMLPPMAVFFPLFTIMEDYGYLPRVAFNLDYCFKKCCSCGKQALTMCMGFVYL